MARGADLKAKNSAMAARMKAEGVTRNIMRCPMCSQEIGISSLPFHMGRGNCGQKRKV